MIVTKIPAGAAAVAGSSGRQQWQWQTASFSGVPNGPWIVDCWLLANSKEKHAQSAGFVALKQGGLYLKLDKKNVIINIISISPKLFHTNGASHVACVAIAIAGSVVLRARAYVFGSVASAGRSFSITVRL
jgi:hypothetical protein